MGLLRWIPSGMVCKARSSSPGTVTPIFHSRAVERLAQASGTQVAKQRLTPSLLDSQTSAPASPH